MLLMISLVKSRTTKSNLLGYVMSFNDQLAADLSGVFFSDFGDDVLVNGISVRGRLSRMPHEFSSMGGSVYYFESSVAVMPSVKKGSSLVRQSDSRSFVVQEVIRENDIIKLVL